MLLQCSNKRGLDWGGMLHAWSFSKCEHDFCKRKDSIKTEAKCEGVVWNSFAQDTTDVCCAVSVGHDNESSSVSKQRKIS